ncbi:MAG: Gfo/Idh/MocA family oxidoreductase [Micropruina glycogenica]
MPGRGGLIGAGMISDTYLDNLTSFPDVEVRVLMVSDRDVRRAPRRRRRSIGVPTWGGADDVLAHPDIELVVNLTIPAVHAQVSSAAIAAGKHVWSEKPLGITRESASSGAGRRRPAPGCWRALAPDTPFARPRLSDRPPGDRARRHRRAAVGADRVSVPRARPCFTPTPSSCSPSARGRCSTSAPTT